MDFTWLVVYSFIIQKIALAIARYRRVIPGIFLYFPGRDQVVQRQHVAQLDAWLGRVVDYGWAIVYNMFDYGWEAKE